MADFFDVRDEVTTAVRAGIPGVHLKSSEYLRVDDLLSDVLEILNFKPTEWSLGNGLVDFYTKRRISLSQEENLSFEKYLEELEDVNLEGKAFVIKHASMVFEDNHGARAKLQDFLLRIQRKHRGRSAVFLCSESSFQIASLASLVRNVTLAPLSIGELRNCAEQFFKENGIRIAMDTKRFFLTTCVGMEEERFLRLLRECEQICGKKFNKKIVSLAVKEKKYAVAQSGVVELVASAKGISDIGGLEHLKRYLRRKKRIIDDAERAVESGITLPKGILLAGMPGCGKSLTAKATAALFNLPLLRLDVGSLMGKYVGESEQNLKLALRVSENVSPCVLWLDELEKAFSGIGSQGGSAEITTRLFGYFLTWMQEKESLVFVVATVNDLNALPPEILRRGRFDEIFYVTFPEEQERREILEIFIKKAPGDTENIDLDKLARQTEGFSGADLEFLVSDALEDAFFKNRRLDQESLEKVRSSMVPMRKIVEKKIAAYEKVFKEYSLKPASLSREESRSILDRSKNRDSTVREEVARDENALPSILMALSEDSEKAVREAVLQNPACPPEVLKRIFKVENCKFNFNEPGRWHEVSEDEFELALRHPRTEPAWIVERYRQGSLSPEKILEILSVRKRIEGFEPILKKKSIELPGGIPLGFVRAVYIREWQVYPPRARFFDLDNQEGRNIPFSNNDDIALVAEIRVSVGERVAPGKILATFIYMKENV